jgi:membrane protein required for colicin V production
MNGVDLAIILALVAFALRGYGRGFFRESFGLVALIAGVAAALRFSTAGTIMLQERLPLPPVAQTGVVFVGIFVLGYTVVNLIGVLVDRLVAGSRPWVINRLAGTVLGVAKGSVVLAVGLLFLHLLPLVPTADAHIMASAIGRPMVTAASDVLYCGGDEQPPGPRSRS